MQKVLKAPRAEIPHFQGCPRYQLQEGRGGVTREKGRGPRGSAGAEGMCYCEDAFICWAGRKGGVGSASEGRCTAEFIRGKEAGKEVSPERWTAPSALTGVRGKRPNVATQLGRTQLHQGVHAMRPLQAPCQLQN